MELGVATNDTRKSKGEERQEDEWRTERDGKQGKGGQDFHATQRQNRVERRVMATDTLKGTE